MTKKSNNLSNRIKRRLKQYAAEQIKLLIPKTNKKNDPNIIQQKLEEKVTSWLQHDFSHENKKKTEPGLEQALTSLLAREFTRLNTKENKNTKRKIKKSKIQFRESETGHEHDDEIAMNSY